jgi:hypothetical protein
MYFHNVAEFTNCLGPPTALAVQTHEIHGARRGLLPAAAADLAFVVAETLCFFGTSFLSPARFEVFPS